MLCISPDNERYWREDKAMNDAPCNEALSQKIALARDLRRQHSRNLSAAKPVLVTAS